MGYETQTCADCGRREPMDLPREVRFAGEYGPLCDDCLPLALRVVGANAAPAPADPALLALATLGAMVTKRAFYAGDPFEGPAMDAGVVELESGAALVFAPGIADAIAALLAPDGAASEGKAHP